MAINPVYDRLRDRAAGLMAKYGRPITLVKRNAQFDPNTGTSSIPAQQFSFDALTFNYSTGGFTIQQGELLAFLSAVPTKSNPAAKPEAKDLMLVDGETWSVKEAPNAVQPIGPAGVTVMWAVTLQKGVAA